ncbi:MAG: biotin--[acetyl-CoA-carboxylase] ligase [Planctomycetota bacterium]|nr:biotin--[acetyl-CoA-carboxylase] ligase [Planctomycetota bacterium]
MKHFHFNQLDSTNTRAEILAGLNPARPLLVSARTQTRGRGRTGRPWSSPAGGAWMTLAWPVRAELAADVYAPAPLVAGLAILQTLAPLVSDAEALAIKWPNDVLLAGGKVAGVLCERVVPASRHAATEAVTEAATEAKADGSPARACLLIGVGVNANIDPADLGTDLRHPATSLRAHTGQSVALPALILALGRAIAQAMRDLESHGFTPATREAIEARLAWRDEPVTLNDGGEARTGVCRGLDERGALVLEIGGVRRSFEAGEVHGLSPAAAV